MPCCHPPVNQKILLEEQHFDSQHKVPRNSENVNLLHYLLFLYFLQSLVFQFRYIIFLVLSYIQKFDLLHASDIISALTIISKNRSVSVNKRAAHLQTHLSRCPKCCFYLFVHLVLFWFVPEKSFVWLFVFLFCFILVLFIIMSQNTVYFRSLIKGYCRCFKMSSFGEVKSYHKIIEWLG